MVMETYFFVVYSAVIFLISITTALISNNILVEDRRQKRVAIQCSAHCLATKNCRFFMPTQSQVNCEYYSHLSKVVSKHNESQLVRRKMYNEVETVEGETKRFRLYAAVSWNNIDVQTTTDKQLDECPEEWFPGSESCFYVGHKYMNWYEAKKTCEEKGGYLAEIDTAEDIETMKQYFKGKPFGDSYFLGGSDEDKEGDWTWMGSGKKFGAITNWANGEPNNGATKDQHCLAISMSWYKSTVWDDIVCSRIENFVCEM